MRNESLWNMRRHVVFHIPYYAHKQLRGLIYFKCQAILSSSIEWYWETEVNRKNTYLIVIRMEIGEESKRIYIPKHYCGIHEPSQNDREKITKTDEVSTTITRVSVSHLPRRHVVTILNIFGRQGFNGKYPSYLNISTIKIFVQMIQWKHLMNH